MKRLLLLCCAALLAAQAPAQTGYVPAPENLAARAQFADDRFGIFIHWGLYALLGQGEWVMTNRNIDYREYEKLAGAFYPAAFDAAAWVTAFREAGARYICFTTRHHDGFSMFRTAQSGGARMPRAAARGSARGVRPNARMPTPTSTS